MMYIFNMETKKISWLVIYYEGADQVSEVFDFVSNRKESEKAKVLALLAVLEEHGPQLPRPYADLLEDGIHELRIKLSGNQVRILYFFCFREFIVLTNVFIKHSDKVPGKEIKKAQNLRADFLHRHNEQSLRRMIHENS